MTTTAQLLDEYEVSEAEFTSVLAEALRRGPRAAVSRFTTAEEQALVRHGGVHPDSLAAVDAGQRELLGQTQDLAGLIATSKTVDQVARAYGVDASRIRHRVRDGALYGARVGRSLRLPDWQFIADGQPLPGLRSILAALPNGLHPLDVAGFMSTPQPELEVSELAVTPRDWLASGGSSDAVTALAGELYAW